MNPKVNGLRNAGIQKTGENCIMNKYAAILNIFFQEYDPEMNPILIIKTSHTQIPRNTSAEPTRQGTDGMIQQAWVRFTMPTLVTWVLKNLNSKTNFIARTAAKTESWNL